MLVGERVSSLPDRGKDLPAGVLQLRGLQGHPAARRERRERYSTLKEKTCVVVRKAVYKSNVRRNRSMVRLCSKIRDEYLSLG